jgi:class 3 adenylate cyclase
VETSIRIARNYGERIQRIVVSGVGAYEELVYEHLLRSQPTFDVETSRRTSEAGRQLIDAAEELLVAAHRRHMEAALLAMWVRGTETRMALNGIVDETTDRLPAIAFVDLSGFTRLTEEEGDALGLWLEERLVSEAELAAAAHGARIVKRLGDGVMLHGTEPARLVQTAVQLVDTLPRAGLPSAHAGIHAGPLIERDGDYFGRTVNLAARIAGQASAGEVLLSPTAAARAPAGLRLTELPPVQLRGISEPTILFRVERT